MQSPTAMLFLSPSRALAAVLALGLAGCAAEAPPDGRGARAGSSSTTEKGKTETAAPLTPDVGKWAWLDIAGMECANGEPTGIAVNRGTSSDVLVFFEGGGACWSQASCFGLESASNVSEGYSKANFEAALSGDDLKEDLESGVLSRTSEKNPFREANFVYIPYCTGDVFAGDTEKTFPDGKVRFRGRKNVELVLDKIVPSLKSAERVTVAGRSAGGFGSTLNYWRVQQRFTKSRVDLIDDSGPPFDQENIPFFDDWREAWDLDGAFPPGCADCKGNLGAIVPYYAKTFPESHFALLSYDRDPVISLFFLTLPTTFADRLKSLTTNVIEPLPNMRYFVPSGMKHMMLGDLNVTSGDTELGSWLAQMSDGSGWDNVSVLH